MEDPPKEEKTFLCSFCGKTFNKKSLLSNHLVWHKSEICYCLVCGKGFKNRVALNCHKNLHLIEHERLKESTHKCDVCDKCFPKKRLLKKHVYSEHMPEKIKFKCHLCGETFFRQVSLDRHLLMHGGPEADIPRPYSCDFCGKRYFEKGVLKAHKLRKHFKTKVTQKCATCNKTFVQTNNLIAHEILHKLEEIWDSEKGQTSCQICKETYTVKEDFKRHLSDHENERPDTKSLPFEVCEICNKAFSKYSSEFKRHMNSHLTDEETKCETCGKEFVDRYKKARHMSIHMAKKEFKCETCGKEFTVKRYLDAHMKIHKSEKQFTCPKCGQSFNLKGNLTKHIQKGSCIKKRH